MNCISKSKFLYILNSKIIGKISIDSSPTQSPPLFFSVLEREERAHKKFFRHESSSKEKSISPS